MLNKMFYFVRIVVILGLSLIGSCYNAYAYTTEVSYGCSKKFTIFPGVRYRATVTGVGIKTNEMGKPNWGDWDNKYACCIRSVYNGSKQALYKNQTSTPLIYEGNERIITFQFLIAENIVQPEGVFCEIEVNALDSDGKIIPDDKLMSSFTQMTMHENTLRENTLLDIKEQPKDQPDSQTNLLYVVEQEPEQKQQQKFASLLPRDSSHTDDLGYGDGYGDNEDADNGCCGGKSKRKSHGA